MKTRAVIFLKNRTNDVVIPNEKRNDLTGRSFRHKDAVYFLDPERVQITSERALGFLWRKYYSTQYYIEGVPNPLPVPDFKATEEAVKDAAGKFVIDPKTGIPRRTKIFPEMVNLGVDGDMLAQIFNSYFLRILAAMGIKTWEKVQFILIAGTFLAALFVAWQITQQPSAHEIAQAILAAQDAATSSGGTNITAPPVVVDPGA